MKRNFSNYVVLLVFLCFTMGLHAQIPVEPNDPENPDVPSFYKSKLTDIKQELAGVKLGEVKQIAESPGGLPVYAVCYGVKDNFHSQANYNSAVAARNPGYFAKKTKAVKPVVFFLGPVHGQEGEGIAGLINLIRVAETGKDHRGKEWAGLKSSMDQCRVIIIPCGNPDGRKRCPYDGFVGLPGEIMTKYGQGTHSDGTLWRWPEAKSLHPMKGDVALLGAYYNNDGINMMHDDFFLPMAEETRAILKVARDEAPDMTVSLHSHNYPPCILQPAHVPYFMKERVAVLANRLNDHYKNQGLPYMADGWQSKAQVDDEKFPPRGSFNLISALHHISGTMSFTFECCHGTVDDRIKMSPVDYDTIVDIQLNLYQEMFNYLLANRLCWE